MTKSRTGWLWFIAAASPALLPLWLILRDGVNLHFVDEWDPDLAGIYIKAHLHQLTLADWVCQHNEHRLLVPRLIYFLLAYATDWNNMADLLCGWAIVCATSLGILWLCRRTAAGRSALLLWFICNLLIFTPEQSENWLWGIGVANFLPMALFIGAVVAACWRGPAWLRLAMGVVLAFAATFSNASGFATWPLVGCLLARPSSWSQCKTPKSIVLAWIGGFVLTVALYSIHYQRPEIGGYWPRSLGALLGYNLVFLGNAFGHATSYPPAMSAAVAGAVMMMLLLVAVGYFLFSWRMGRGELCNRMLVWLVVAGFSVISSVMAAHGRSGYGLEHAHMSRYVTHAIYLPVALVNLVPILCEDLRGRMGPRLNAFWIQLPAGLTAVLILMQAMSLPGAISGCHQWRVYQTDLKASLLLINILPDNPKLPLIYPWTGNLFRHANALNEMGYLHPPLIASNNAAEIRASDPSQVSGARGKLDKFLAGSADQITLAGWAIFSRTAQPADAVFLTYQNENQQPIICAQADLGLQRDDIVEQTGNADYLSCGWQATVPLLRLPADIHLIRIKAWALDTDTAKAWPLDDVFSVQR